MTCAWSSCSRLAAPKTSAALLAISLTALQGARGQQPSSVERSTFYMLLNADTLSVEHVARTADRLEGDFVDRLHGIRIRYAAVLSKDRLISSLETWAYRSATDSGAQLHATVRVTRDTVVVEAESLGPPRRIATQPGTLIYINPLAAFLEQALLRARALGGTTVQVPLFQAAGGATAPLTVTWIGADSARLILTGIEMAASVGVNGRLTRLAVPSQNVRVLRVEGVRPAALERPE